MSNLRFNWLKKWLSLEVLLRLVADTVLINLAIVTSLALRLLWIIAIGNPQVEYNYTQTFWESVHSYGRSAWLLTLICLFIFSLSGFYTYGRFYRGRYKALIVVQAVSIGYLIFGLLTYLSQGLLFSPLAGMLNFPRGALILSWGLTIVFLVAARAWIFLWSNVVKVERYFLHRPKERAIHHVLVIGGAGYIGSALLPKLLGKGYRVRVLDLLLYGTEPIEEWMDHPRLEVIQADFRQIDRVVEAMRDIDALVHLGGIVGDPACALDAELTTDINLMATRMIAEVAKGSGVGHFVFASTCSVYGASDQNLDERSRLNPISLYARSKIASEQVLLKMADDRFSPVILRFGTIYGLSGRTRFDLVINLLTAKAVLEDEMTVFGGDQWRPFLHVSDAAESIVQILETPLETVRNQIFNVGSNHQNYTIRQIGEIIQKYVPTAKIIHQDHDIDPRNYWVNFNKINRTLLFEPKWTVEQGIEQVIRAIRSGKIADYRHAKYSNVKFLTEEGIFRLSRHENGWAYELMNGTSPGGTFMVDPHD
jgi:nucleoside-diphosphate-sugar epimerase/sorbitol-specific phosphotransferase system component IIC